jgi:two-component system OmpR family response regulator
MNEPRILLVEDDMHFREVLCSYLEMHGYDLTTASDGEKGAEAFRKGSFDLCILDVMMPKKDGFALAKEIREVDAHIPIIFLTAKTMKEDVIRGFRMGGDDYIAKPFNSEELLFRIQAVLKRAGKSGESAPVTPETKEFSIGRYRFNYPLRQLSLGDHQEKLSPKEAELLRLFCLHLNEILPRSEALKKIWHEDNYFTARSMDVFVTKLRKYLREDPTVEIVNIHGNGFQLRVASPL